MSANDPSTRRSTPQQRVVLLGASNLTRGISTVAETACLHWGRPLELMAALGHGRSYGFTSHVLGRGLPGIIQCGLWRDLASRPQIPTAGLLTDIGNDILYGAEVPQIIGWLRACLDRLAPRCRELIITAPPLCSLRLLGKKRFLLLRTILFPRSKLTLERAWMEVEQLSEAVAQLANEYEANLIVPRAQWYGSDPIHIRMKHWASAWQEILSPWSHGQRDSTATASMARWLRLRTICPEHRTWFGISQQRQQPGAILADGNEISFY